MPFSLLYPPPPPLNLSTSPPSAVIPRTDPRLPFSPFPHNPKLQGELTTGTRLRILSSNQTSDFLWLLPLLLLLIKSYHCHTQLPKKKRNQPNPFPFEGIFVKTVVNYLFMWKISHNKSTQFLPLQNSRFEKEEQLTFFGRKKCSEVGCLVLWQNMCGLRWRRW